MTRQRSAIRNNAITYGAFLVVAVMLWFLNALGKEYVTEVTYPVKYGDIPKGKILEPDAPREITLEIRAHGFSLLRHKLSTSFLPVVLNVNSDLLQKSDVMEKRVNMTDIKERLAAQFHSDIQVLRVKPESILFKFARLKSKKLPVVHDTRYALRPQYILQEEITISPDSVVVEGPAAIIDTLRVARLAPVIFEDLYKNVSRNVPLLEIPGVHPLVEEARVSIKVERYTEGRKSILVIARNLPASLKLRLFPSSVEVTYNVGLSRYDQVLDAHFVLSVDYRQVADAPGSLEVKVEKAPPFIQNLTLSPERLEFLVEQK
ncbi:MAG: YbbR-like domain-containing protein [Odoribacteraceae bacterium]|nr:YbbR-like domain-containing protein [Odoribacteraceae bacterium]